jgi:hypothetical protein
MLIHPHALNFVDQDVSTTLERINPALTMPVLATLPMFSMRPLQRPFRRNWVTTFPPMQQSSFICRRSPSDHALQGLTPEEIAAYLCAPGRDVSSANVRC